MRRSPVPLVARPGARAALRAASVSSVLVLAGWSLAVTPGLASHATAAEEAKESAPLAAACEAIRLAPDATRRLAAVRAALHRHGEAFVALDVPTLTTLAPDVLRVYDLTPALRDGEDAPAAPPLDDDLARDALADEAPASPGRAARIAEGVVAALRAEKGGGPPLGDAMLRRVAATDPAPGTTLVVWAAPERFPALERALDALATTGGPRVPVEVTVARAGPSGEVVARYEFDVPWNRTVSAWRRVRHRYALPASAGRPAALHAPRVGAWGEGLAVSAWADGDPRTPRVSLRATVAFAIAPVPEMTSSGAPVGWGPRLVGEARRVTTLGFVVPPEGARTTEALADGALTLTAVARGAVAGPPIGLGARRLDATSEAPGRHDGPPLHVAVALRTGLLGAAAGATVSVVEGGSAEVSVTTPLAYVLNVAVEPTGPARYVDPVLGYAIEGLRLDATGHRHPEGGCVLEGNVVAAVVDRPIATRRFALGVGAPVTLQVPVVREASRPFRVHLREGAPAEVLGPRFPGTPGPASFGLSLVVPGR